MVPTEDKAEGLMENPWRWQPHRNPYLHNLFTILGLDDPYASSTEFNGRVSRLTRALKFGGVRRVFEYTPTGEDLAAAQAAQKDATRLTIERLLVHMVHRLDEKQFEEFAVFFGGMDAGRPESMLPLPVVNVGPLARRLPVPARVSASMLGRPDLAAVMPLLAPDPRDELVLPL